MTDRPAIFSGPMVRALLREVERPGTGKTMTRRIVKPQPDPRSTMFSISGGQWMGTGPAGAGPGTAQWDSWRPLRWNVGDRLYVREAFAQPNDQITIYRANWREDALARGLDNVPATDANITWRPSIHLPRVLSRLTLIVTAVKIEPLNDISEEDARAEGVLYVPGHGDITYDELWADPGYSNYLNCRMGFEALWNTLHGEGAWLDNPAVVATTFIPELRNIDQEKTI